MVEPGPASNPADFRVLAADELDNRVESVLAKCVRATVPSTSRLKAPTVGHDNDR